MTDFIQHDALLDPPPSVPTLVLEEDVFNAVAKYLYTLAAITAGQSEEVYLDAADALMDVLAMWADDERIDFERSDEPEGDAA
jgi:hypothetical protein